MDLKVRQYKKNLKNLLDWGLSDWSLLSSQGKYHLIFLLGAHKKKKG